MEGENPLTEFLSRMEREIGPEAYQANIKHAEVHADAVAAANAHQRARTEFLTQTRMMANTYGVMIMLPITVRLWRWALGRKH